ncbi:hypothetical protein Clacol_000530 [Clathrus columnatus]|uniref:Bola-like protein n=1 Tax=Clathrus columnatus TaxID=1419009 RepID=A0AAV5A0V0_9AGAM|nr:hypothetical protein Clacol_000530 [Clathrus columnatus]
MSAAKDPGPVETAMKEKLTALLNPIDITIRNDSWQHRHHPAMRQCQGGGETHFSVDIVSEAFKGKTTMQRHRMIYSVLSEEMANKGLHALSLKTKTPEEIATATTSRREVE